VPHSLDEKLASWASIALQYLLQSPERMHSQISGEHSLEIDLGANGACVAAVQPGPLTQVHPGKAENVTRRSRKPKSVLVIFLPISDFLDLC
jgi:hypothetical protein